ncbi:MAG: FkbM family methyltransferase [Candidatus Fimenecus sp.]
MLKDIFREKSSWEYLKSSPLPIAVYGTGNGADRVFEEFKRLGITVSAVIASDGFVRTRTFHGFEVKSISALENELSDFTAALAFASHLPQVIDNIKSLSARHKVLMPSVPVYGDNIFNKEFFEKHFDEIEKAYDILADEKSKSVFESIIRFQITGELKYTFDCESGKDEAFSLLDLGKSESFLDLGAYRGDTIDEFLHYAGNYKQIVALEPDCHTFKKLKAHCEDMKNCVLLNSAVWSADTVLSFDGNLGRGGNLGKGTGEIPCLTVDGLYEKYGNFTYINCDAEGTEKEMLKGAKAALSQFKPKLCIASYHRSEDIFELINMINEINGSYKIYLRHHPHISFWDTNLYCI